MNRRVRPDSERKRQMRRFKGISVQKGESEGFGGAVGSITLQKAWHSLVTNACLSTLVLSNLGSGPS